MKFSKFLTSFLLMLFITPTFALMPPSYLSIKKWKSCVATYQKGSAEFICIPDRKPLSCPNRSWQQLTDMSNLPSCPPSRDNGMGSSSPLGAQS